MSEPEDSSIEEETEAEEDSSESTTDSSVVVVREKRRTTTTVYLETDEDEDSVKITEEAQHFESDPSYTEVSSEDMSSVSTARRERSSSTSTSESDVEEILPFPAICHRSPVPSTSRVQRCSQRCADNLSSCVCPRTPVPSTSRVQSCFERRAENLPSRRSICRRSPVPSTSRVQSCFERRANNVPCSCEDCPCILCFPERKANFVKKNVCDACRQNRNCRFENWNFLKDRHASEVSEATPSARNRKRVSRRREKENCEPEAAEVASSTRQRTEAGDDTNQSEMPMEEPPKSTNTENSDVIPIMEYYLPITKITPSLKVSEWLSLNGCMGAELSPVEAQKSYKNQDEEDRNYSKSSEEVLSPQDRQPHRSSKNADEDDEEEKTVDEDEVRIGDAEEIEEWIVMDDDGESEEQALSETEHWITIEENGE